jgi:enamine deaminase RidA (YjgF/YER057c/UK114 family)
MAPSLSNAGPLRQYFGEVRPAAMMISAGLADPRMKIEIEVTALKRS